MSAAEGETPVGTARRLDLATLRLRLANDQGLCLGEHTITNDPLWEQDARLIRLTCSIDGELLRVPIAEDDEAREAVDGAMDRHSRDCDRRVLAALADQVDERDATITRLRDAIQAALDALSRARGSVLVTVTAKARRDAEQILRAAASVGVEVDHPTEDATSGESFHLDAERVRHVGGFVAVIEAVDGGCTLGACYAGTEVGVRLTADERTLLAAALNITPICGECGQPPSYCTECGAGRNQNLCRAGRCHMPETCLTAERCCDK